MLYHLWRRFTVASFAAERGRVLRYLQRYGLLPLVFLSSVTFGFAQSGNPPPPPPPPAIEYSQNAWKEFSSAAGGFRVSMPGTPTLTTDKIETAAGPVTNHLHTLSTKTAVYMISYVDFPFNSDEPGVARRALDSARNNALAEDPSAKLLSEKEVSLGGQVGREWLVQRGAIILRARAFLVRGRLYQVLMVTGRNVVFKNGQPSASPQDRTDFYEATSNRFLHSFKFSGDQPPAGKKAGP
jgi:hypothetical protein